MENKSTYEEHITEAKEKLSQIKMLPRYKVNDANDNVTNLRKRNNKKKTTKQYKQELYNINPNIEVMEEYIGANTKILHRCKICSNEWNAYPHNLLKGHGCPVCSYKSIAKNNSKSHEDFVSQINQNIELLSIYTGAHKPVSCKCKICNYVWDVKNAEGLLRTGCPNCVGKIQLSHEEFIKKVSNVLNKNVKIIGKYVSAKTKIECKCITCGNKWFAIPELLLKGCGCKKCADINNGINKRKNSDSFLAEMAIINPNIEILEKYKRAKDTILCKCKICSYQWSPSATSLLSGYGCPKCSGQILSEEDFIKSFIKNGDKNIKLLSNYINSHTKIRCQCLVCNNEWYAIPQLLKTGVGCKKCADKKRGLNSRLTNEEFVSRVKLHNPNVDVIDTYTTAKNNIKCKCNICNKIWFPNAYTIMTSSGCPNCSSSKGENHIDHWLKENNILYVAQKTFKSLLGVGGGYLKYDFYLPQHNLLIEFQGKQHEEPIEYFGGEEKFKIQQEHDRRKREYAKLHNIQLLEIWYYDIDNIESILSQKIKEINKNNLKLESVETVTVA